MEYSEVSTWATCFFISETTDIKFVPLSSFFALQAVSIKVTVRKNTKILMA